MLDVSSSCVRLTAMPRRALHPFERPRPLSTSAARAPQWQGRLCGQRQGPANPQPQLPLWLALQQWALVLHQAAVGRRRAASGGRWGLY